MVLAAARAESSKPEWDTCEVKVMAVIFLGMSRVFYVLSIMSFQGLGTFSGMKTSILILRGSSASVLQCQVLL